MEASRQCENIKITISLTLELDCFERERSCKLIRGILELIFISDPTWSKEETEELRDLLRLPSFPSSPLLPVAAFARDFGPVGVFTWFRGYLVCKELLRPLELCGVREGGQIIRLTLGFSEAAGGSFAPSSSSSFFFSSPFSSFFSDPPTWL